MTVRMHDIWTLPDHVHNILNCSSSAMPLQHILYFIHQLLLADLVVTLFPYPAQLAQCLGKGRPFGDIPLEQVIASDGKLLRGPVLEFLQQLFFSSVLQQLRDPVHDFWLFGSGVMVKIYAVAKWWRADGIITVLQDEQCNLGFLV